MNRVKYLISAGILLAGISSGLFAQPQQPAAAPSGPALSEYFTPVEAKAAPAKPDDKGFIRRWTLLEPISFPNRTNTVFTDSYIRETFAKPFFKDQFTTVPKNGATVKVEVEAQAPVNLQFGRPAATQQQPAERRVHHGVQLLLQVHVRRLRARRRETPEDAIRLDEICY